MSIYCGSNKIGKIFVGSTEIAKVYKGSTLVFENAKKIPVYGYQNRYLLGSNSTSGIIIMTSLATIASITGSLGASGSKVSATGTQIFDNEQLPYYDTKTFDNTKLHIYATPETSTGTFVALYVIEDAKVGSKCGYYNGFTVGHTTQMRFGPDSITSASYTYGSNTYSRVAANDTNYTRNGFK